ncbi:MAG: hypothetical protein HRT89_09545 [Lentisphaeria bacterium]|nr:hypothetical protein [Lentisphaeria bacterium]NQZ68304.1 hypothetical protein [Lentisphaeria bacterium]
MGEKLQALVDFQCIDCAETIDFNLMTLQENDGQVSCKHCHRPFKFSKKFQEKLLKLRQLIVAIREAEDIIDDCNVSVTTAIDNVKVPYRLLLTRMNTLISLKVSNKVIDFNFRIEPLNDEAFK